MCIINNTKKVIFIHIPKAAGTSVAMFFSNYSRYCDLEVGATYLGEALQLEYYKRFKLRKHSTVHEIQTVMGVERFAGYKTFVFVRNPYDRLFSAYKFLRKWSQWDGYDTFRKYKSYAEFVESGEWKTDMGPDQLFLPQVSWLRERGNGPRIGVDHVCKVENMNVEIDRVCGLLGVDRKKGGTIPKLNRITSCEKNMLPAKFLKMIRLHYAIDFDFFGYDTDYGRYVM